MKRSKELLAGVGLAATLVSLGATACGGGNHHKEVNPRPSHSNTSSPYTRRLQGAADQIIALAEESPGRYEDKPPFTIGFTLPTTKGGTITYEVQTTTPQHEAYQTEMIGVQQTGPNEPNFDLSLYEKTDKTWNMYCNTNPYSTGGPRIAELGEETVQTDTNPKLIQNPGKAETMLYNEIVNLGTLIDAANGLPPAVPPSPNVCDI